MAEPKTPVPALGSQGEAISRDPDLAYTQGRLAAAAEYAALLEQQRAAYLSQPAAASAAYAQGFIDGQRALQEGGFLKSARGRGRPAIDAHRTALVVGMIHHGLSLGKSLKRSKLVAMQAFGLTEAQVQHAWRKAGAKNR